MKENQSLTFGAENPSAIVAAETARARIQAAYLLALKRPRNEEDARARILATCKDPAFAELVEYSKPIGGTSITGLSIRFVEAALREWGNVLVTTSAIYEDDEIRRISVSVLDLETNVGYEQQIETRKLIERKNAAGREVVGHRTTSKGELVYIVKATEEEIRNKENSEISRTVRNHGARILPPHIKEEAVRVAREVIEGKITENPKAAMRKIFDGFSSIGISPAQLQAYVGQSLDALSPKQVSDLRALYVAIRDGETTWGAVMEQRKAESSDEDEPKSERLAKHLSEGKDSDKIELPPQLEEAKPQERKPRRANQAVINHIKAIATQKGYDDAFLLREADKRYGAPALDELTSAQANEFREAVRLLKPNLAAPAPAPSNTAMLSRARDAVSRSGLKENDIADIIHILTNGAISGVPDPLAALADSGMENLDDILGQFIDQVEAEAKAANEDETLFK